ncbi:hypothetical protein MLD38_021615 [Melastoma candidum]|uniref:Uncharacterized protein n=1 Tax=Melastoma candidum TaxID=119954 RepID=A0ACB9QHV2_9MYRT|nr:hypothetical protein MLD38_021615 [Melastoma candidum]
MPEMAVAEQPSGVKSEHIFKGIRRYYCEYCGIRRSKESIILAYVHHHNKAQFVEGEEKKIEKRCDECCASFRKPLLT